MFAKQLPNHSTIPIYLIQSCVTAIYYKCWGVQWRGPAPTMLRHCSVMSSKIYGVFISFRGKDTRKNLTSHIQEALIRRNIKTFIDNEIQKGDDISPALTKAIEESRVSIVIFSQRYPSSQWCLNELLKILQCKKDEGQIVMPVFYNIRPTHVRNQTGSYKKAFAQHERDLNLNKDRLLQWKAALTEASNISGWDSQKYRTDPDMIKAIVDDVWRTLNLRYPFETEGLVGIENNCKMIESFLQIGSNDVRILGLWGIGGIGKTTLAKASCSKLCSQFEGYCFLENVGEEVKKQGLSVVHRRLFSELLKGENLQLDAPYVENSFFLEKLDGKKVFIVLDDVATSEQIEDIFINKNWLGPGSRVIVTTRDEPIHSHVDGRYEIKPLNKHDSLKLFCLNAFRENYSKSGYEELLEIVIAYCNGNPLALKVLGAYLHHFKSKEAWKNELEKLQKIPNGNINGVFKLSFDGLVSTQKDIFLDIACFYRGSSVDNVTSILEACGFYASSGIEVLLDKSLISISNNDTIVIHDLVVEMAREMVCQESIEDPGKRSRLWNPEEVAYVLKNNKGTENVEGITFKSSPEELNLRPDSLKSMTELRYLDIGGGGVDFPDGLKGLSDKLRWLRWDGFPLKSLPSSFCADKLVELNMPGSKLKKLWDGVMNLPNLKMLSLYGSKELTEMPDLSRAPNIERVFLSGCENLRELLASSFSLPKLAVLDLQGCRKIESVNIPSKSLQVLDLSECSSLTEFSVTSEEMEWLSLGSTAIRELPSCIWHNSKLSYLNLSDCKQLSIVRKNLSPDDDPERLGFLTELNLSGCTQMDSLNLGVLLDRITSLKELYLSGCCNLEAIPDNIQRHSMLEKLVLDDCRKLVSSGAEFLLPSLLSLRAANCTYLDTDSTQWIFLENMLQSIFSEDPPQCYEPFLLLPAGVQVLGNFDFRTVGASITIPPIPTYDLHGFVLCVILSQGLSLDDDHFLRCISGHDKKDFTIHKGTLISDHVLLYWYGYDKQETGGENYNLPLEFKAYVVDQNERSAEMIKGCGVLPVYYTSERGLELDDGGRSSTSNTEEIFELKSNAQVSDHELVIGGKSNENQEDQQATTFVSYPPKQEEDMFIKSSCVCSFGLGFPTQLNLSGYTQIDASYLWFLLDSIGPSLQGLDLSGCCNLEVLPDNIYSHSLLERLVLDDCRKLVFSLTELPSSLRYLRLVNCCYLDTYSIQQSVLDEVLQTMSNHCFYEDVYVDDFWFLSGSQVPGKFDFQTEETSITLPPIPNSELYAFIFCIVLSGGLHVDLNDLGCFIYEDGKEVDCSWIDPEYHGTLISDHVLLWRFDYNRLGIRGDHYNLSFDFKFRSWDEEKWSTEGIKGCGVHPVYVWERSENCCNGI